MAKSLIQRLDEYRDIYDINIQLWDTVNIYVHVKDAEIDSEYTSVGGYSELNNALRAVLKVLDKANKKTGK